MSSRRSVSSEGLSLVEVWVSLSLVGLIMTTALVATAGALVRRKSLERQMVAGLLAGAFLEEARVRVGRPIGKIASRRVDRFRWVERAFEIPVGASDNRFFLERISSVQPAGSRTVRVSVGYEDRGAPRNVRGETVVAP